MFILKYMCCVTVWILVISQVLVTGDDTNSTQVIYIGGFFSSEESWDIGQIVPSVKLALDHINNNPNVLPDYELRMVWNDTQCDPNRATWALYHQLYTQPTKLAIIGDACSSSTQPIAANAAFWNLNTVSYGAGSPSLSKREDYPYFFRTILPDSAYNAASVHLIQQFGWTRVATLHGMEEGFISAGDDLEERLAEADIYLISSQAVTQRNVPEVIESIKNDDAKIILLNMDVSMAQQVFCEAYHNGTIGPGYVWMLLGLYSDRWWEQPNDNTEEPLKCSKEEMRMAVESSHYISIEMQLIGSSETVPIANITTKELIEQLTESLNQPDGLNYTFYPYALLAYDAAWSIALMLDKAAQKMQRSLTEFTYQDIEMAQTFFKLLNETNFSGVSGEVKFNHNGDRIGTVEIRQFQPGCNAGWHLINSMNSTCVNSTCVKPLIGSKSQHTAEEYCNMQGAQFLEECPEDLKYIFGFDDFKSSEDDQPLYCCKRPPDFEEELVAVFKDTIDNRSLEQYRNFTWPGDQIPSDQTQPDIIRVRMNIIQPWHYLTFYAFSILGIVLCVFLLVFNTMYREQWYVKRSSPGMNNLIVASCLLIYLLVFPGSMENSSLSVALEIVACRARTFIFSLGFVLGFGTMVVKTWRVYKVVVFKNVKPQKVVIKNKKLYTIISIIVGIDVIILLVLCSFETIQEDITSEEMDHNTKKITVMFFEYCITQHVNLLRLILWSYHGILVVLGMFLTWQTRHLPKKFEGLVDNKIIGICIYMLALVVGAYLLYIVSANPNPISRFIVTSSLYLYYTTFTLLLIFAPMVKSVINKDPPPKSTPTCRSPNSVDTSVTLSENPLDDNSKRTESETKHPHELFSDCRVWCYGLVSRCCVRVQPDHEAYNVAAVSTATNQNQNEIHSA